MSSYDSLAASYDGLMADAAYLKRADYLDKCLKKSRIEVETILDLGCGTGTISCLMAEKGYRVLACDASIEMLSAAMMKSAGMENAPMFLHQSMEKLRLASEVDAVISTIDAINYLTKETALRETFKRVYKWLRPGGQFIFDVNSPYKLRRMDGQLYTDETEESYCVWRTFFSERTQVCTYQVDLFRLNEGESWDREFEEHRERAWSEEQLREFLTEAGFANITISGDLTLKPPKAEEDRWIVRAEKL
jgi:ubiquinone/menaquinone biosynthesis C-methylase UbiE